MKNKLTILNILLFILLLNLVKAQDPPDLLATYQCKNGTLVKDISMCTFCDDGVEIDENIKCNITCDDGSQVSNETSCSYNCTTGDIVNFKKECPFDPSIIYYPEDILTKDQIKKGGFLLYIFGILYCFLGISLVTQNYINPSIDVIKQRNLLSSDSMNATILAMTNSAAESFIILNSIYFGVVDIGVQTVVQQTAFTALVIQGTFYLLADKGTRIDWWIITRDTIYIVLYLSALTGFLQGNMITSWNPLILLALYIIHILLMKYNYAYEIAIKKALARYMEVKELKRICKEDISKFHCNPEVNSRRITSEMLRPDVLQFVTKDELILSTGEDSDLKYLKKFMKEKCPNYVQDRRRLIIEFTGPERLAHYKRIVKPITCIKKSSDDHYGIDDYKVGVRNLWKRVVNNVLIKIQAYKFQQEIERDLKCRVDRKQYMQIEQDNKYSDESSQEADYDDGLDSQSARGSYKGSKAGSRSGVRRGKTNVSGTDQDSITKKDLYGRGGTKIYSGQALDNEFQMSMKQTSQEGEPATIYDIIHQSINKEAFNIRFPKRFFDRVIYLALIPLTHIQWIFIPNPINKPNYYPLSLFNSILFIWGYTFLITWFTCSVSIAFGLDKHYSIIPMILYPFGISIRDRKKFVDFKTTLQVFNNELQDQEISLAETYSGPIFQITGLLGVAWFSKAISMGKDITFVSSSIQYQFALLIGVVAVKYIMLAINQFKTKRAMFALNVALYCLFLGINVVIDYI